VVGHQYTSSGNVHGINGNVDLNNFTEEIFVNSKQPIVEQPRQQVNTGNSSIRTLQQEINIQFAAGLVVDGIPGPKTLAAAPLVKEGAQGNITRWIQSKVGTRADGVFGSNTKESVKNYQASRGISADGIVGQNTWRKLLGL
jgi:murein L,D-transpeptidase YcbB/YkuD